jgi:hypothetical protein
LCETGNIPAKMVNSRLNDFGRFNPRPTTAAVVPSFNATRVESVLSWLILIFGIATLGFAGYLTVASYTSVPFMDEWVVLDSLATAPHPLPLGWLVLQNGEHRILFYKLLLLADLQLSKGNHLLIFVTMYAVQLLFLAIIAWTLRTIGRIRGVLWRASVGGGAFCLFCPSQWENLSWAFQISFFLVEFFAFLAILSIAHYGSRDRSPGRRWQYVLLAIMAAAAATYSNANGMLVWPVLICIAVALKASPRVTGVLAASGLSFVAPYFFHYTTPIQHARPLQSIRHPLILIEYVAKYFGGSFLGRLAVPIGVAGLLAAAALAMGAIIRRDIRRPIIAVLFGLILFCFATASVTALGRLNFGTDQAFASRYQTFALLFWFGLGCLLFLTISANGGRQLRTTLLAAVVVIMLLSAVRYKRCLRGAMEKRVQENVGSFALMTGVPDQKAVSLLFPINDNLWRQFPPAAQNEIKVMIPKILAVDSRYLRDRQLSFFSGELYRQLNHPLTSAYRIEPQQTCVGYVDAVERVRISETNSVGLRISGWAVDARSRGPVRRIVVSANDAVVGFGEPGFERLDLGTELRSEAAPSSGWIAYAQVPASATSMEVYGVVDGHRGVCRIASVPFDIR